MKIICPECEEELDDMAVKYHGLQRIGLVDLKTVDLTDKDNIERMKQTLLKYDFWCECCDDERINE